MLWCVASLSQGRLLLPCLALLWILFLITLILLNVLRFFLIEHHSSAGFFTFILRCWGVRERRRNLLLHLSGVRLLFEPLEEIAHIALSCDVVNLKALFRWNESRRENRLGRVALLDVVIILGFLALEVFIDCIVNQNQSLLVVGHIWRPSLPKSPTCGFRLDQRWLRLPHRHGPVLHNLLIVFGLLHWVRFIYHDQMRRRFVNSVADRAHNRLRLREGIALPWIVILFVLVLLNRPAPGCPLLPKTRFKFYLFKIYLGCIGKWVSIVASWNWEGLHIISFVACVSLQVATKGDGSHPADSFLVPCRVDRRLEINLLG